MKNKTNILIFLYVFMGLFIFYASSCKKEDEKGSMPELTTTNVSDITETTAISGGVIITDGGQQ